MRAPVHDPGWLSLRRAVRTAIVASPLFALCLIGFHNPQMATFAAFGSFAMLAFADFVGPPRPRFRAYATLTACGIVLIAVATLVSRTIWLAAAGMAAAGFLVTFSGVLGGYVAAGGLAAMLSFVLAAAVPAGLADLPARLAGWCLAGLTGAIAAAVLWPARPRVVLRRSAAEASARLADLVDAVGRLDPDPVRLSEMRARAAEGVTVLESDHAAMLYGPAGPATHDESFAYLVDQLRCSQELADELAADRALDGLPPAEDRTLGGAVATTLRAAAVGLEDADDSIDLVPLERARRENYGALDASLRGMLGRNDAPAAVAQRLQRAYCMRVLSYATLSAGANAALTAGKSVAASNFEVPPLIPPDATAVRRLNRILETHLRIESVWFQAAIRAAVALAAAILVAGLARLEHGFWVVLATTSALKSSATGTRHTAWQALAGTLAGFGAAIAFVFATGGAPEALWIALPICIFLAVYTPTAVHFMFGQALFTVTVVVLFNLVQPEGWRTALVRVEDILIGLGTAVIVGAIFWPRGAHGQLRASLASLFEAGGAYFVAAVRRLLSVATDREASAASTHAQAAGLRASEAFATFLTEPGPRRLPVSSWGELLVAGNQLRVAGDALLMRCGSGGLVGTSPDVTGRLVQAARNLERAFVRAGRSIVEPVPIAGETAGSSERWLRAACGILGEALPSHRGVTDGELNHVLTIAFAAEWIAHVGHTLDRLAAPLREVQIVETRPPER